MPVSVSPVLTLILSLITNNFACHVSDRRLTDGSTGRQLDSKASKTVIAPQLHLMVSYTGLAQLAPQMTTDEWLLRTIWGIRGSHDFFGSLAEAAGDAFKRISLTPRLKRHVFVVSGWLGNGAWKSATALPENFTPSSYCTLVSNFHDFEIGVELTEGSAEFSHRTRLLLPGDKFQIFAAGARLTSAESTELESSVSAALRSAAGGERAAAVAMLRTVQRVSDRDPTVGGGAFVVALPRDYAVPTQDASNKLGLTVLGVRWGLPEAGSATFVHISDRPTEVVESPGIIADPFAGSATLTVKKGKVPNLAGIGGSLPEEFEGKLNLIALRSSEEIARLSEKAPDTSESNA